MNEQKYYVRLKLDGQLLNSGGFYDDELGCDEYNEFTKSELAEIMDGALYKHKFRTETQDELFKNGWCIRKDEVGGCVHWEWINPLIELVPVGDDDVSN